ncbi:MAG: DUF1631 family protein [Pseudomonadota bacterium]
MTPPSQAMTNAYQACLNEAFKLCPLMIRRWCGDLADALYERSMMAPVVAEKRQLQTAISVLKTSQLDIENGFALELTRFIAEDTLPVTGKKVSGSSRSLSSISFDELELMGDDQVQETMDGARLQQVLSMTSSASLAGFSARLSTAQGFSVVRPDKNPLRPEIMSRALLGMLRQLPGDSGARSRWLTYGAQLMGNELQTFYDQLNELLVGLGVPPATYGVVSAAEDKGPKPGRSGSVVPTGPAMPPGLAGMGAEDRGSSPDSQRDAGDSGYGHVSREQLLTLDHLHRLMVGDYDDSFAGGLEPSGFGVGRTARNEFSHTVPAAMDVLAELKQKGLTSPKDKRRRLEPPKPVALLREQLKTEAKSLGQSVAIEVVGMMIEQLVRDNRLLPPVQKLIADIEPAFLRLSVIDPRFFSNKKHPARQLLESITAKSLAYSSEEAAGFAGFMLDLQKIVDVLSDEQTCDAQQFETLLQEFEEKQAWRSRETSQQQGRAVQALLQAERRNLLAEKIAAEIRVRPDFVKGNRIITAFLTGPWAQVMAQERLLGEHGGLGSAKAVFSLALGDVLWSLNPVEASRHRKRLIQMIPGMLNTVREGLLSIDYPLERSKDFYDEMMQAHQVALKPAAAPASVEADAADARARNRAALDKAFEDGDHSGSPPWLAPTEARQSGFMDIQEEEEEEHSDFQSTLPRNYGDDDDSDSMSATDAANAAAGEAVELQLGDWVELLADTRWLRAQLTWISPHYTLFMFTSEGGRSHSMTGRVLKNLLALQLVKVVSQHGVLDGALDNVARTAMRNSMDGVDSRQ